MLLGIIFKAIEYYIIDLSSAMRYVISLINHFIILIIKLINNKMVEKPDDFTVKIMKVSDYIDTVYLFMTISA